jgi:hypothetical protein
MGTIIQAIYCRTDGNSFGNSPLPPPAPTSQTAPPPEPSSTGSPSDSNSNPSTNNNNSLPSGSNGGNVGGTDGGKRKVGGGAVAGIVISLAALGAMVAFFLVKRKSMRLQHGGDPEKNVPLTSLALGKFKRKSTYILSLLNNYPASLFCSLC